MQVLSRQLNATYMPHEPGSRISGVYERAITTPTGRLAVIRREDTYTLAPWKAALEPMRGQAVTALIGPNRVGVVARSWARLAGAGLDLSGLEGRYDRQPRVSEHRCLHRQLSRYCSSCRRPRSVRRNPRGNLGASRTQALGEMTTRR